MELNGINDIDVALYHADLDARRWLKRNLPFFNSTASNTWRDDVDGTQSEQGSEAERPKWVFRWTTRTSSFVLMVTIGISRVQNGKSMFCIPCVGSGPLPSAVRPIRISMTQKVFQFLTNNVFASVQNKYEFVVRSDLCGASHLGPGRHCAEAGGWSTQGTHTHTHPSSAQHDRVWYLFLMYLIDLCLSDSDALLGNDFWCAQRTIRFRYMPEHGRIQPHI